MANKQKKNHKIDTEQFTLINLSALSKESGISYNRLYNNLAGIYPALNLSENEKNTLCNVIHDETKALFKILGYKVSYTKID